MKSGIVVIMLGTLIVAACSGSGSPVTAPTPSASASATEGGGFQPATVTLKDELGDTDTGDLTEVKLVRSQRALEMTVKTEGDLVKQSGEAGLFLYLLSIDGNVSKQLGVKWLDGRQIAYFVSDLGEARQDNLPGEALVRGDTITASFPTEGLTDLGQVWQWQAGTAINGQDVDTAPEPGDGTLPKMSKLG